jgi:hypothetical protein
MRASPAVAATLNTDGSHSGRSNYNAYNRSSMPMRIPPGGIRRVTRARKAAHAR